MFGTWGVATGEHKEGRDEKSHEVRLGWQRRWGFWKGSVMGFCGFIYHDELSVSEGSLQSFEGVDHDGFREEQDEGLTG